MLFSSSTSAYGGLSSVANAMTGDIWPYLVIIISIPLAFFIIELLVDLVRPDSTIQRADKALADFDELHRQGKV